MAVQELSLCPLDGWGAGRSHPSPAALALLSASSKCQRLVCHQWPWPALGTVWLLWRGGQPAPAPCPTAEPSLLTLLAQFVEDEVPDISGQR